LPVKKEKKLIREKIKKKRNNNLILMIKGIKNYSLYLFL